MLFINRFKLKLLIILVIIFSFSNSVYAAYTVTGPVLGSISSIFGMRVDPINGIVRHHDGIDIAAPYGSPVYAMQDGVVMRCGLRGGYGLAITLDHYYPNIPLIPRVQTTYGHCSVLFVHKGDYIKRGQVIALVGSTGHSTGPHLHFEVTYKGSAVNPIEYLVKLPGYLNYIDKVNRQYR